MAFAIIRTGGKQYQVTAGDVVHVPSIADKNAGDTVEFETLVSGEGSNVSIASSSVTGGKVTGTIIKHGRAPKVIVFKFKRRKQFKRKKGHRQGFTTVKIDSIA